MEAPQAGFLSDDNLWFWLALLGPWKNKIQFSLSCTLRWKPRAQPFPLPCSVLPRSTWRLDVPQGKKCGKPSDLQNNIDLCSVSEKHMKSPSFACAGARCIPFLGIQRQITACAAQNRVHGLSLCHHELLGRSLQNSKADQRRFSLCLLCFLSPSSFSGCWCKLGVSLLKEVKL